MITSGVAGRSDGAWANPLALGPLDSRADVQRSVRDLCEPLQRYTSIGGANVRLGSHSAVFPDRVAELAGFARPLYGIVPLTVGGGSYDHWGRVAEGLDAGTDPNSPEYWGAVAGSPDQRMVEQAAIGLALAFCPEHTWEQLGSTARTNLVNWLQGIYEHDPVKNNWQFFRVLVSLGLERVGASFDRSKLDESLKLIDSYRRGDHWYQDGMLANIDYYVPWAFHTYGLMYTAANRLGLGDDGKAAEFAERASGFTEDFVHWFGPDGSAIPYGRSLTYRFATGSMWGAMAWADVESPVSWDVIKGMSMRHIRWWADKAISDRDGVASIGYTYDNRRLAEGYNSAGSPYWCMKYFTGLAAPEDHPFWTSDEAPQPPIEGPVTLPHAGWVVDRDEHQTVSLIARKAPAVAFMEQMAQKYDKFAYSSVFGFSAECESGFSPPVTDSTLALTDEAEGIRRIKAGAEEAGVEDGMAWSTWFPYKNVRVDTVLCGGAPWHLRLHLVTNERALVADESGFAVGYDPVTMGRTPPKATDTSRAEVREDGGVSAIVDVEGGRKPQTRMVPVNANIMRTHTAVPVLTRRLEPGQHTLITAVYASPDTAADASAVPEVPQAARDLLDRIAARDAEPWPALDVLFKQMMSTIVKREEET